MKIREIFGLNPQISFNKTDLSKDAMLALVEESTDLARKILNGTSSQDFGGRQRTLSEIQLNTFDGLLAEHYLISNLGWSKDNGRWKDVISPNGIPVEIKTYSSLSPSKKQAHINNLEKRKTKYEHVLMFKRTGGVYTYDSYWTFNKAKNKYQSEEQR